MKTLKIIFGLILMVVTVLIYTGVSAHVTGTPFMGVLLFTATTGVGIVTQYTPTYCPQFIYFVAATTPTGLRITPAGDSPIVDLDAAGLTQLSKLRLFGAPTNSYLIPIADGHMLGQNIEIIFTNSAAQTPNIYAISQCNGSNYYVSIRQQILANSGADINKFAFLGLPSLAAGDSVTITYKDGLTLRYSRDELAGMLGLTQNDLTSGSGYSIDNFDQNISKVNVITASTITAYILRVRTAANPTA